MLTFFGEGIQVNDSGIVNEQFLRLPDQEEAAIGPGSGHDGVRQRLARLVSQRQGPTLANGRRKGLKRERELESMSP